MACAHGGRKSHAPQRCNRSLVGHRADRLWRPFPCATCCLLTTAESTAHLVSLPQAMKLKFTPLFSAVLSLGFCRAAEAQWQTQSLLIRPGWTAVYLHVDASYQTIDQLVGADPSNPISEIWLWRPAPSTLQFVTS